MAINWTLPASSGNSNGDQNAADDPPIFPAINFTLNDTASFVGKYCSPDPAGLEAAATLALFLFFFVLAVWARSNFGSIKVFLRRLETFANFLTKLLKAARDFDEEEPTSLMEALERIAAPVTKKWSRKGARFSHHKSVKCV